MSGLLRKAADAEVISLDLRGHGQSSGRPGDVDYVGQYTDDLADVIKKVKHERPDDKIILAGHSMGGGIILRYVQRQELPRADAYLLFAPSLGHNAPTLRTSGQENSNADEPFLKKYTFPESWVYTS
jgi:alpha-beta hydrolase superfamily lysophospholipase